MADIPNGYQEKIENILGASFDRQGRLDLSFEYDTVDEAKQLKKKMILMQKQLRSVKKEANMDMKLIRSKYQQERAKVADSGFFTGLFAGKKAAGRVRQTKRQDLAMRQKNELAPYENVKSIIDSILLEMDRIKMETDTFVLEES